MPVPLHKLAICTEMKQSQSLQRRLNLQTSISNVLHSADALPDYWASIFYAAVKSQQGRLLYMTGSLLLKSRSCFECMKVRHSVSAAAEKDDL